MNCDCDVSLCLLGAASLSTISRNIPSSLQYPEDVHAQIENKRKISKAYTFNQIDYFR